jgi:WD40 repeat protein
MAPSASKVFISYNRADLDWAEWIAGVIERGGYQPIIQAWHFRPGEDFVLKMQQAATESDMTIAVLSEAYLNAEFTQPEWSAAFARDPTGEKRGLIPIRVAECSLTGMLLPRINIDLVGLTEQDAERVLLDSLKPSGKPAQPPPFPGKRAEPSNSTAPFPPSLARLHGVPELPPHYLERHAEFSLLMQKLLTGSGNLGITGQSSAVGVQGMGGIGKTVLAAALVHDLEIRQAFPDGIYWLTVGQKPNLLDLQNQLLRQSTGSKETLATEQEAKYALQDAIQGRRAVLVLDDVWTIDAADALSVTAPPARLLITTRNNEVLVGLGAEDHRVDVLSTSDALKMLTEWAGEKSSDELPPEAAEIARECGYLPLALAMIGAMIRLRPTAWKDVLVRLRKKDLAAIKRAFPQDRYPYPDLFRAIEVSVEALEEPDRERYLDLAVFPKDQPLPEGTLSALWKLDDIDTRDCMTRLVARSLGRWTTGETGLILHDLQHDLIHKRREKELAGLHLRLVKAWDALPKLPDTYAWHLVAYHLEQAGCNDDLRQLLLNFNYLQAKLAVTDTNALIADYNLANKDNHPADHELRLMRSAIRLSAHVLARDARQLAGQLIGRLLGNIVADIQVTRAAPNKDLPPNNLRRLLNQAADRKAWPWLRPLNPNLTPPGGPLIRTLEDQTHWVYSVTITPDGRHAISGSHKTLRVWDLESGQTAKTLEGHTGCVLGVAVMPEGRRAISASADRTLRVWDLETGQTLRTLQGHIGSVTAVAVTPDGRRAVSASGDWTLRVWDLESSQTLHTLQGHIGSVTGVAVLRERSRAVSSSQDHTLRIWDLEGGKTLRTLEGHTGWVEAVVVTSEGCRAISASADRTLRVWDLETGQMLRMLQGHMASVTAVAVTPDGRHAVSASEDRTLRVWDLETGETSKTIQAHVRSVTAVAVGFDGRVVSASTDRTLCVWDLAGQTEPSFEGHTGSINVVATQPDGRRAISASDDGTLRVWDSETGRTLRTLEGHTGSVDAVAIHPDGRRAISGSRDATLRVWDLETGKTLRTLEGQRGYSHSIEAWAKQLDLRGTYSVTAVAVTPDGRNAISALEDTTLQVWDLETGQMLRVLEGHMGSVTAVALTPEGRQAVSASEDRTLRVWDLGTGQTLYTLEGHTGQVHDVAVTPDGRHAVSASGDRTLRVWDLLSAREIATFTGECRMLSCAFAPDLHRIIVGDELGRVHFLRFIEADKSKPRNGDIKFPLLHQKPVLTRNKRRRFSWLNVMLLRSCLPSQIEKDRDD